MGKILEYIKMALKNITANKGRSFLTMLGIIIGIASVIMVMAVGDGTANAMNAEVEDLGTGQIYVRCSDDAVNAEEWITSEDMAAVKNKVDGVEGVSPNDGASGTTITGKGEFSLTLSGGTEDSWKSLNYNMKRGNYYTEVDVQEGNRVCVLTNEDAKRLFGSDDVVGMDIDVNVNGISQSYRIIGVTQQKENGSFVSYTYEGMPVTLNVPYTSFESFGWESDGFYSFYVFTADGADAKQVTKDLIHLLDSRHQSSGEDYYQIQSFQDTISQMNGMLAIVTTFISCVAAISLFVGGIGVMNIMLVSVTERTREIGIRKSLGAKTSSILMQFLAEAAILTIVGGILGILLGFLGALGICGIMSSVMASAISPGIKASTIIGATLFSCAIGIFFGIYPAKKAAKLSPIEALRRN
ncbi:ABC transporter permease [Roseburia sp. 499]|uniref:ABC transporter permease n=1 Tax=Roseburia sp. 499 TaxID=1261634 RepID=UPI000951329E|nr:ABC transporter permease [Roseburia sp. 499]WVK69708.1 ABC transporter permease [Roseburia sp. 499]